MVRWDEAIEQSILGFILRWAFFGINIGLGA